MKTYLWNEKRYLILQKQEEEKMLIKNDKRLDFTFIAPFSPETQKKYKERKLEETFLVQNKNLVRWLDDEK